MPDPFLVPAPKEIDLGRARLPDDLEVREGADPSLPAQGYELVAGADGVTLRHADPAGLRYGRSTLDQLRRDGLREARVRDWPDLPARGFMLDISRDRVPDRACLAALVERLDRLRINHLELYTEHTFAYADHELVWRNASPMTVADLRWLDGLCAERGIELVANQNCFGHFERWLAHPPYADRAADPEVGRSLAPTEDNARFALDLVAELTDAITSRQVNLGCDEVFELHGQTEVFLAHLRRLLDGARSQGLAPRFWADMVQAAPEEAADLGDATALLWHYEAPMGDDVVPLLQDLDLPAPFDALVEEWVATKAYRGFRPRAERLAEAGLAWWVCPGTSGWNSLVGRWSNARANLLDAVEVGADHGAAGILITEWGDNGHVQPPTVMLPALAYGAALAWGTAANRDLDVAAALDGHVLPDAAGRAGRALLDAGDTYLRTGVLVPNGSALHDAVVGGGFGGFGDPDPEGLAEAVATLDAAIEAFAAARFTDSDAGATARELRQAAALARHGAKRLLGEATHEEREALVEEQAACWGLRSRPGGLLDSLARLAGRRLS
jgi:hypothetical protein